MKTLDEINKQDITEQQYNKVLEILKKANYALYKEVQKKTPIFAIRAIRSEVEKIVEKRDVHPRSKGQWLKLDEQISNVLEIESLRSKMEREAKEREENERRRLEVDQIWKLIWSNKDKFDIRRSMLGDVFLIKTLDGRTVATQEEKTVYRVIDSEEDAIMCTSTNEYTVSLKKICVLVLENWVTLDELKKYI